MTSNANVDAAHRAALDLYEARIVRLSHEEEVLKQAILTTYAQFRKTFTERTMLEERRDEFSAELADLAAQLREPTANLTLPITGETHD